MMMPDIDSGPPGLTKQQIIDYESKVLSDEEITKLRGLEHEQIEYYESKFKRLSAEITELKATIASRADLSSVTQVEAIGPDDPVSSAEQALKDYNSAKTALINEHNRVVKEQTDRIKKYKEEDVVLPKQPVVEATSPEAYQLNEYTFNVDESDRRQAILSQKVAEYEQGSKNQAERTNQNTKNEAADFLSDLKTYQRNRRTWSFRRYRENRLKNLEKTANQLLQNKNPKVVKSLHDKLAEFRSQIKDKKKVTIRQMQKELDAIENQSVAPKGGGPTLGKR